MSKEPLTDERIAEIRGREKVASDGPWGQMMGWDGGVDYGTWVNDVLAKNGVTICSFTPLKNNEANADFVVHAREDIPALLDEVERLRAENERLKEIAWNGIQLMDKAVIREAASEIDMVREKVLRHAMEQEKRRFS